MVTVAAAIAIPFGERTVAVSVPTGAVPAQSTTGVGGPEDPPPPPPPPPQPYKNPKASIRMLGFHDVPPVLN